MAADYEPAYAALRAVMARAAAGMDITRDEPGEMVVRTPWLDPKTKEPGWFGSVKIGKGYVSYHLMPLYALPELRDSAPPELAKRMRGKTCFNFKRVEPELFQALERLTAEAASRYGAPVAARPHG